MTVRAIYEDGVFKPAGPVNLPERAEVELDARLINVDSQSTVDANEIARKETMDILSRRYSTGQIDAAARHNEHQQ
jgi:predicted DNA-binding antitoxin AbrB/MazE fold protein